MNRRFNDMLSRRATGFIETCSLVHVDRETIEDVEEPADFDAARTMKSLNRQYGSLVIPAYDGVLAGWLSLGTRPQARIWQADSGELIFQAMDHDTAQCAVTMSSNGRIGSSFTTEFHPLFDSIEHLIEDCAAWHLIRGWHFVSVTHGYPGPAVEALGDIELDEAASGQLSKWWLASDCAVVAQQYLTHMYSPLLQISVLTPSQSKIGDIRRHLSAHGVEAGHESAVSARGIVREHKRR